MLTLSSLLTTKAHFSLDLALEFVTLLPSFCLYETLQHTARPTPPFSPTWQLRLGSWPWHLHPPPSFANKSSDSLASMTNCSTRVFFAFSFMVRCVCLCCWSTVGFFGFRANTHHPLHDAAHSKCKCCLCDSWPLGRTLSKPSGMPSRPLFSSPFACRLPLQWLRRIHASAPPLHRDPAAQPTTSPVPAWYTFQGGTDRNVILETFEWEIHVLNFSDFHFFLSSSDFSSFLFYGEDTTPILSANSISSSMFRAPAPILCAHEGSHSSLLTTKGNVMIYVSQCLLGRTLYTSFHQSNIQSFLRPTSSTMSSVSTRTWLVVHFWLVFHVWWATFFQRHHFQWLFQKYSSHHVDTPPSCQRPHFLRTEAHANLESQFTNLSSSQTTAVLLAGARTCFQLVVSQTCRLQHFWVVLVSSSHPYSFCPKERWHTTTYTPISRFHFSRNRDKDRAEGLSQHLRPSSSADPIVTTEVHPALCRPRSLQESNRFSANCLTHFLMCCLWKTFVFFWPSILLLGKFSLLLFLCLPTWSCSCGSPAEAFQHSQTVQLRPAYSNPQVSSPVKSKTQSSYTSLPFLLQSKIPRKELLRLLRTKKAEKKARSFEGVSNAEPKSLWSRVKPRRWNSELLEVYSSSTMWILKWGKNFIWKTLHASACSEDSTQECLPITAAATAAIAARHIGKFCTGARRGPRYPNRQPRTMQHLETDENCWATC